MADNKKNVDQLSIKLPSALKTRLQKLGKLKQRSAHWLMKEAIEHYLDQEEQLENLKQQTLNRWDEAELGEVLANDSVIAWLETWGDEKEQERP